MEKFTLPTGYLIVDDYSKGKLETLSIGGSKLKVVTETPKIRG